MILVLGLLTLLAVAHTDGGHVKGRPAGDWTQEKLHQDDIPSPQISVAPTQDAVEGWIHDPAYALEDHARVKTVSKAGAADALHPALGEQHGKAQTAPIQVKTIVSPAPTGSAANNPVAIKTVLKKTQILTQGMNDPTATVINRQSIPMTRAQYKVKTIQHTIRPITDSDSALKFVPGSPRSPVQIPGQLTIPKEIEPFGLGPYSADFGQRTRVLTSGPSLEFSTDNARISNTDTSKPSTISNQQPTRARGEAQRQTAVTAGQNVNLGGPSYTALSPEDPLNQPLVYAPPSADITPEMIAAIEEEIGGRIVTGNLPGTDISQGDSPLGRIPTGLLGDENLSNLPKRKLKPETPTVQNVDYRKDSIILRPQTQGSSGIASAGYSQLYTGAGRRIYKPPTIQSPVRPSVPVQSLRRTPSSAVVPPRTNFNTPVLPLDGKVPISGVDGNLFGHVGQIFEMSPEGNLTPVSGSKLDAGKYSQTLKEKILGNERTQKIVPTVRKPVTPPQVSLTAGRLPIQPLDNVPISGLDGKVQDYIDQIFEISADGQVVPVSKSPAKVQPETVATSPRKPTEVKPASQPPLSVASLRSPRKPQATPISRSTLISPYLDGKVPISGVDGNLFGNVGQIFEMSPEGNLTPVSDSKLGTDKYVKTLKEKILGNERTQKIVTTVRKPDAIPQISLTTGGLPIQPFGNVPVSGFDGNVQDHIGQVFEISDDGQVIPVSNAPARVQPVTIATAPRKPASQPPLSVASLTSPRKPQATPISRNTLISPPRTSLFSQGFGSGVGLRGIQSTTFLGEDALPEGIISNELLAQISSAGLETPSGYQNIIPFGARAAPVQSIPGLITGTRSSQILYTGASPFQGTLQEIVAPGSIPQGPLPLQIVSYQDRVPQILPISGRLDAPGIPPRTPQIPFARPQAIPPGRSPQVIVDRTFQTPRKDSQTTVGRTDTRSSPRRIPQIPTPQRQPPQRTTPQRPLPPSRISQMQPSSRVTPVPPSVRRTPQVPPSSSGTPQTQTTPSRVSQIPTASSRTRTSNLDGIAQRPISIQRTAAPSRTQQERPSLGTISQIQQSEFQAPAQSTASGLGVDLSKDKVPISGVDGNIYGHVGQIFEMSSDGKLIPVSDSQISPENLKPAPPSRRIIAAAGTRISPPASQIAPRPQISRTTIQTPKPAVFTVQRTQTRTNLGQLIPTGESTRSSAAPGNIQSLIGGISSQRPTGPQTVRNEEQIQLNIDEDIKYHPLKPSTSTQFDPARQMTGPKSTFQRVEEISPQVIPVAQGALNDQLQQQLVQSTGFSQIPPQSMSSSQVPLLTRGNKTPETQEQVLEQVLL